MAKKTSVVIYDSDEFFLDMMERYLLSRNDIDAFIFSKEESLKKFFGSRSEKVNVVLLNSIELLTREVKENSNIQMILGDYEGDIDGIKVINKYQKTKNMMENVLLEYAQVSGDISSLTGNKMSKSIAFFSPVGGSGKTTLAFIAAQILSSVGKKTLYVNLENINSTAFILPEGGNGNMSKVFLSVSTKSGKTALSILSSRVSTPGGWHYFSCPESVMEINEMEASHITSLMQEIDNLREYDFVIYDLSSDLSEINLAVLKEANMNIMPFLNNTFSMGKIDSLYKDPQINNEHPYILEKSKLVLNKSTAAQGGCLERLSREYGNVQMSIPELPSFAVPEYIMSGSADLTKYGNELLKIMID